MITKIPKEYAHAIVTTPGIEIAVFDVSPRIATLWMTKNIGNRPMRAARWRKYVEEMERGWHLNGEPIIFIGEFERLASGQHRLTAVIESGITIRSSVVWGVGSECFPTIDTGAGRTGADFFASCSEELPGLLCAALTIISTFDEGRPMVLIGRLTNPQLAEVFERHPEIRESCKLIPAGKKSLLPPSILSALHFLFCQIDRNEADRFIQDVITGANLEDDDPVFVLRARLTENLSSRSKLSRKILAAMAVKAWNCRFLKRRLRVLKLAKDETFPEIAGLLTKESQS